MALPPFDRYHYYSKSVQSPDEDMAFLDQVYHDFHGKKSSPKSMREDFCAGFLNCCSWVKRGPQRLAYGIDLDPEPLQYGKKNYLTKLKPKEAERIKLFQKDVLGSGLPKAQVICALNFSYSIFKDRPTLKKYFKNVYRDLSPGGIFVVDAFGGLKCWEPNEDEITHDDHDPPFSYFWDQDSIDPLTHHAKFYIHFKRKGEAKRERVFSYDWRLWTVPEVKDLMEDVGFRKVVTYWEGTTDDGDGDGNFQIADQGEDCESWVSYIAALK
jgi:SAM-dependent methyltransferase